MQIHVRMRLAK